MIFNECIVNTIKCVCLDSPIQSKKEDESETRENSKQIIPITLSVERDFFNEIATLEFDEKDVKEFHLKSIEVTYQFGGYVIPNDILKCITSSRTYQFSLKAIKRHVLYDKYVCKIVVSSEEKSYEMEFSVSIPYFQQKTEIKLGFFDTYFPPDNIIKIFNSNFLEHPDLTTSERILLNNIQKRFLKESKLLEYAVSIEDLTQQLALEQFTLLNVKIHQHKHDDMKSFKVNSNLPPNVKENNLCLVPMDKYKKAMINKEDDCIFANIDEYSKGIISFKKRPFYDRSKGIMSGLINIDLSYAVRFVPNRITHRASLHAIEKINELRLDGFFENFSVKPYHKEVPHRTFDEAEFKWFNKKIAANKEQKIAITNIVNGSAFPFPYIIFGPPGTGKTSCIIECIAQILTFKPDSKIFVTAQSNSACDEVGERLLQYFDITQIYRFYTPSIMRTKTEINKNLLPSSNIRNPKKIEELPSQEELKHFQIVICTLTSSSKFERANLSKHFDYIFIDECAATTEPEALISILGLGCLSREVYSNIVLIGDHKQLPPVISSEFAKDLGLGVSLMERMMKTDRYKPNPDYDNRFVVQLLDNFRSHPAILHFSNVEFYDSKLRAKNSSAEVMLGTKWEELPNKNFPIIFHSNKTPSELIRNGTSSYNDGEAEIVQDYVSNLLESRIGGRIIVEDDIGIVTPYLAQRDKLKKKLPQGVEIGTSEYYQGREKLIIIISTVKSKAGVGFLSDERRLNVCLTRAKALMIIVGNPDTLQQDKLWKRFTKYCKENNAMIDSSTIKKGNEFSLDNFCSELESLKASEKNGSKKDKSAAKKEVAGVLYSDFLKKMNLLKLDTFPSLN